jgi:hypothetical protein
VVFREAAAKDEKDKNDVDSQFPEIKPGPEHEILKRFVGTWEATISMATAPGAPAVENKGTETNTLGCGGLWLIIDYKGDFGGKAFHGHGIQGYDQEKKKYAGVWVDPMSRSLDLSEGAYDRATKTLTSKTRSKDPQSGQVLEFTSKNVFVDDDHRYLAMHLPGPDGKEFEVFKINYKRKK